MRQEACMLVSVKASSAYAVNSNRIIIRILIIIITLGTRERRCFKSSMCLSQQWFQCHHHNHGFHRSTREVFAIDRDCVLAIKLGNTRFISPTRLVCGGFSPELDRRRVAVCESLNLAALSLTPRI